ncbi:MAG: hypothetical protein ACXVEE_23710 [Polyangiales bacterium]
MRIFFLLALPLVIVGCSSSEPTPADTTDAETDVADAPVDTGPTDPCKDKKCPGGVICDPLDGVCKKINDLEIGGACGDAGACTGTGKTCISDPAFVDGYCTITPCSADAPCPKGSTCAKLGTVTGCFKQCAIDGDCRGGIDYKCRDIQQFYVGGGSRKVCYLVAIPCAADTDCPTPLTCGTDKLCK